MRNLSRMPIRTVAVHRTARVVLLLAMLGGLGGCASNGGANGSGSFAQADGTATVTFESIDGPPPQVFDRIVNLLDSEAKLRHLAVVPREGNAAAYRVRSYLAAQISSGKTTIAWVWDIYDRDQQRALRLTGEEPTGRPPGRDAWDTADDMVLRRIAQAALTGLNGMINGTAPAEAQPAPQAPARRGPAIASADDIPPQSGAAGTGISSFTAH
jgi:hypothetical protein